jgi:hypothetical protein
MTMTSSLTPSGEVGDIPVWVGSRAVKIRIIGATCDLRPATCDLRPATCDLRPATCDLRPATCDLRPATCDLRER